MKRLINLLCCLLLVSSCNAQITKDNLKASSYKMPTDYYVIDSVVLNLKTRTIKILALEKEINSNNSQHNSLPLIILENALNSFTLINYNEKILFAYDDNCPADGFQGIVAKKNYFTIEQTYCLDFKYVYSYTTFKIDEISGDILLHKYGETYTNRSNPEEEIPNQIWSSKDFGKVRFENVTESFLDELRTKTPKI